MNAAPPNIWRLDETSYVGTSAIGATHYYGNLTARDGLLSCRVGFILTARAARRLTRKEHNEFTWHAGDTSERFDTVEQLRAAAVAVAADLGDPARDIVFTYPVGFRPSRGPALVLAGVPEHVEKLNAIYRKWLELDDKLVRRRDYVEDEPQRELYRLDAQWDETLVELGYTEQRRTFFGTDDGSETFERFVTYADEEAAVIDRVVEERPEDPEVDYTLNEPDPYPGPEQD